MADAALHAVQRVLGKALAPFADGVLEAWADGRNFGLNIGALSAELLQVQATLETAATKDLAGRPATEKLLQNLRDSVHDAEDLLDELDYFRIHDELHGTYDAADQHGNGVIRDLARDACHTIKALGKLVNCFPWQRAELQQRSLGDSFSAPDANREVSGCMPNLGKLLLSSCSPHPRVGGGDEDSANAQETPMPEFNRVDFSRRMKQTVEQLKLGSEKVDKILIHCCPRAALDIAQHRLLTTPQSAEPKLYGRDRVMNSIIHDITEGQYCDKGLTVLPVIGPGGIGKTTLIQHIYNNQQVRNHFPVRIWICVSFNFNLGKVLEEIEKYTTPVEGEKKHVRPEELIEQRLKTKRFLLVLDDIWKISNGDEWKNLLSTVGQSEEKGSMILVTTRQKEIADQVKKSEEPKELNGLEPEEFRKLFLVYVFDAEQYPRDKLHLCEIGDKIMEKLKCSPLAAKTVGRLLRTNLSLPHWISVLESKEWLKQTNDNWIMPALELSYVFLPFHLQQCFSYSALFPEDYPFRSRELISLWIGLDILIPDSQNQTLEDIGFRNLKELVIHGFFREEKIDGDPCYVMHDLLHDLAVKVASHDCLSLRLPNVASVEIQPTTRHLSISTEDLGEYDVVSGEKLKSELEEMKTILTIGHLQTLMLFGEMDESFAKIFGDFFGETNALRVLYLPHLMYPMESVLHNFSRLVHLRCLCLGTWKRQMQLPPNISKFYHLRVLDLKRWGGSGDSPEDMCNLAKLCHYYTPRDAGLHYDIYNVGKLKLLEKLKVFHSLQPHRDLQLQIQGCPEFSSAIPISWINSLRRATIKNVKLLQEFVYSKSSGRAELDLVGRGDLHSLDQVLVFDKETCLEKLTLLRCPPLELKHLLKLKSLKTLIVHLSDGLVGPLVGQGDVEWQLPIEHIEIYNINGIIGKDLTELLPHLPELSKLEIKWCKNIKQLVVGVDLHQTTSAAISEIEEDDDGVLLFPARLCRSLRELEFSHCPELVLVDPPTLVPGRGGLQALQTLQRLSIVPSPRFLSRLEIVPSRHIFPSSLHFLELMSVKGMGTLEPLSNLSSLVTLKLWSCGENLTCQGLRSLLTTGAQLKELRVSWSPRFFDGWEDAKGGEKQQTLRVLETDDAAGLLSAPICSFLSSSLTTLKLCGDGSEGMERFSEEQEDALQLLSSLQELEFWQFHNLQQLPAGLRNLTGLKELAIHSATVSSLPNGGLPESLQKLIVIYGCNEKLRQHCRGLEGTIPELRIQ
ncbi:putative disease resistance protein RGA3 [Triticum aestivum]|uniref:putative disease resistance protein RGA3 n=1 Tax=Triticum aestivum TaxID=4565 RepID=UPI001D0074DD|nr:putative disease resistance protein RGA3 [Triticum aestivum]